MSITILEIIFLHVRKIKGSSQPKPPINKLAWSDPLYQNISQAVVYC